MSNYAKLIKEATKPKPGAPKAKYIDPIIASSLTQDGSLQDICRAIAGRLNESNSLVVFRTLIVVHTLIRNGGVDNVMSHLAGNQNQLKLKNVIAGGNWQGYDAPRMLAPYAAYIEERIKAYKQLQRDPIRSSDSGGRSRSGSNASEGSGSGQRLRRLTVEKGLLRETAIAQRVCNRLLDISFAYFSDNPNDEMAMTAFRMSLKDTLAIYAAINEGVINILEHYFEMAKTDATRALEIYKRFCAHTEKIVAYLASAKKISYSLNIPLPNLRHAPVSLAGALQEYLDDPNFEKNRLEYKENKRIADAGGKPAPKPKVTETSMKAETSTTPKRNITIQEPSAEEKARPVKPPTSNQALQDFFESIETNQMSMFGQQQQQQQQQAFMTGMPQMMAQPTGYNPFINGGGGPFMMPQQTGLMQPQQTGYFMQPEQTGYIQQNMTGFNPFRAQNGMMPQMTGMNGLNGAFQQQQQLQLNGGMSSPSLQPENAQWTNAKQAEPNFNTPGPSSLKAPPSRSVSAPLKPLSAQKTGSRNPFAPPPGEKPPTPPPTGPKGPTLRELSMGGMGSFQGPSAGGGGNYGLGAGAWTGSTDNQQQQQLQPTPESSQLIPQKTGIIGSVASEFIKGPSSFFGNNVTSNSQPQSPSSITPNINTSTNDFNSSFSTLSVQPSHNSTNGISQQTETLRPQMTGFGGSNVKPFQPTSNFGASLLSPQPTALSPNMTGNPFARLPSSPSVASAIQTASPGLTLTSNSTGFGSSLFGNNNNDLSMSSTTVASTTAAANGTAQNGINSQPTGFNSTPFGNNNVGSTGTSSHLTGFGSSLFNSGGGSTLTNGLTAQPTGFGGSNVKPFQPSSVFGTSAFGGASQNQAQTQQQQQQQQQPPFNPAITGTLF